MKHKRTGWFAFDTESGGLDSKENSLLTLSGVVVDDDLQPLASVFNLKIKHSIYHITRESIEINKINLIEHDKEAIAIDVAGNMLYQYLIEFTADGRLGIIGHNVEHDKNFVLNSGLLRKWNRFFNRDVLDTKRIADYLKITNILPKNQETSLVNLSNYFNICTDKAHDAESDLWMTLQVLNEFKKITKAKNNE